MNRAVSQLSVRPATPDDVGLILKLIRELAEYERAVEQAVATEEQIKRNLFGEGFGRGPVAECLIGELGGRPEGFAVFFSNFSTWLGTSGIYLEDLFVRPSARGHGLGKALLVRLAQIAVERRCGRLEWAVLDWNEPAIGFYKALGAEPMDEWTVFRVRGQNLARLAQA
jgi:GNAT superfamily N-acetyltransferase